MRVAPFVLLLILSASTAAQTGLVVSTETLLFPSETTFGMTNLGPDALDLTFPAVEEGFRYGTVRGYGWFFDVETADSLFSYIDLPFLEPPTIPLSSGSTATFRVLGLDPCPVCRAGRGSGWLRNDTLYVRGAGASGVDTVRVVLDLSGYVAGEAAPEAAGAARLRVTPNPAGARAEVSTGDGADGAGTLVDAWGRTVGTFRLVGGRAALDTRHLPAGTYVARAEAAGGRWLSARFVVVR